MKTKFNGILTLLLALSVQFVFAQKTVSGTVSDESGSLPGASVMIKSTKTGTETDFDGKYSIQAKQGDVLVFSYVGMETVEKTVGASNVIDVVMSASKDNVLDEVVITAFGISREKKALGYSVAEVESDKLTQAGNTNIANALQGKVAGVEVRQSSGMPGAPSQILLRGSRSFVGDNTPLYVVDGLPISSSADYSQNVTGSYASNRNLDIDPNDIESISVLKGQTAAALYGIKANNGVIIITTKSGKGLSKGKPVITFNSSNSFDFIARLPELQQTYAQGLYYTFSPTSSYSWGMKLKDLPNHPIYGGNSQGQAGKFWDPYQGKWVEPIAHNNAEEFFKGSGYTTSNSLNIAQSSEKFDYLLGVNATLQDGLIDMTGMDRYGARFNATARLNEKWTSSFSVNYNNTSLKKLPSGNDSFLFTVFGAPPSYDLMNTPYHQEGSLGDYRQISYRRGAVGDNPLWAINNNHFNEKTGRTFGNIDLDYKPNTWLKFHYQFGLDSYNTENEDYYEKGSAHNGQALPTSTQYSTPSNPTFAYVAPTGGSILQYGVSRTRLNSLINITFTKEITDNINGTLEIGNDTSKESSTYSNSYGTGFALPGWNNLSNTTTQTTDSDVYKELTTGSFYNLSLDFKNVLFLNTTGRYDVVSYMPNGSRSYFYPSVSGSFVFTSIDALKNDFLSFGKIRASYAEVGQAERYRPVTYSLQTASSGFINDGIQYPLAGINGYGPNSTLYDPTLKPINTQTQEYGAELRFFKNKLTLDYTYSFQSAADQIFTVPLAGSTGYSSIIMNAGLMETKGHEATMTINPISNDNFDWDMSFTFSKFRSVVASLADGVDNIFVGGYTTPNIRASVGDTYPAIYGEQYLRDANGNILVDEDSNSWSYGMPLIGEFGKIGEVSPNFNMSFNNNIRFKNFNFGFQIDWKDGGQMYSGSNRLMDLYGTTKVTENREEPFIYPGFLSNGQPNNIQRGGPNDLDAVVDLYTGVLSSLSEKYIYDTSFVKIREVTLGYSFPKTLISNVKIDEISLNLSARNFLLWTPLPNFDPETSQGSGNMQGGMDYMSLPQTTSYGLGLNVKF